MIRKLPLCLLSSVLCFLLSGCWDQHELNVVGIVSGMAIDKGKHSKYKMSVEVLNTAELSPKKASGNAASIVYTVEGKTIEELSHRMNSGVSKKLIYSHMKTVVIGEKVAKAGLLEFFDFLERNREMRDDFNVIVAKGVPADDVLKTTYPLQKVSTLKLNMQLNTAAKDFGIDPDIRKKDILSALTSKGRDPVATVVTVKGSVEEGNTMNNAKSVKPDALVEITNLGIFKKEKLIGFGDIKDIRNYLWIEGRLQITSITVPCNAKRPNTSDKDKQKFFAVRIYDSKSNIQTKYVGEQPKIDVHLSVEGRIDAFQCTEDLEDPQVVEALEKKAAKEIENQLGGTIKKMQNQYKVDIFGFGEDMMRQDYPHFKQVQKRWDQEFSRADIHVHALIKLRRTGIRTKSFIDTMKENQPEGESNTRGTK